MTGSVENVTSAKHESRARGAAAYVSAGASVHFVDYMSKGDEAHLQGVAYIEHGAFVSMTRVLFEDARVDDGVIFASGVSELTISDSVFRRNTAVSGSCVTAELVENGDVVKISDTLVEDNAGTPIVATIAAMSLKRVTLRRNGVSSVTRRRLSEGGASDGGISSGGAVLAARGAVVDLEDCLLEDNAALHGGAVAVMTAANVTSFGGNRFRSNTADGGNGGAFLVLDGAAAVLSASDLVEDNFATLGGGAAYFDASRRPERKRLSSQSPAKPCVLPRAWRGTSTRCKND